ncbi:hypothetical protein DCS_04522 [Drechmeria coniospora]|uniref:JmjC domain-containing protein n=1 Tax=Drechmeria coniospora TaxID=98403 RepID=A0A151GKH5_DRECN|nr:hypothetical protein DCS_04522 [Drechmeria coniospora]KYK57512.1 hypothetical protein DCS_04522 [Drechmeria coniospora]
MAADEVINRIKYGNSLSDRRLPINLLSLKFFGQAPDAPSIFNNPRYCLIQAINSRLEVKPTLRNMAEMRSYLAEAPKASLLFSLFAQRGCFTGFHVDSPDGTWVRNLCDLKVWIFPSREDLADMTEFEAQGDEWIPKSVRAIVLKTGDTLIMPSGEKIPHAVLTVEDSYMVGGMFMDKLRISDSIEKLLWIATHPVVTNDRIPPHAAANTRMEIPSGNIPPEYPF